MFGSSSPGSRNSGDSIVVGLDVGGTLFYVTRRKLLQSGGTYFCDTLKGRALDDHTAYTDERGRKVVFVERSPTYFSYVRDFIVSGGKLHLPAAANSNDMALRRNLRQEADFFGLADLAQSLKVSQQFSPTNTNRGLLYWLGTDRGKNPGDYENPYQMGVINVTGWMDDETNEEEDMYDLARFARSRETFVHYQLKPEVAAAGNQRGGGTGSDDWEIEQFSCLQWCNHAHKRLAVVVDLKTVQLQPTHYSLRVSECKGMAGDWNFEGSVDGKKWHVLHKARDDDNLWLEEGNEEIKSQLTKTLAFYNDHVQEDELSSEILLSILEQDYRHTWELTPRPTQFYRYFRLIGASKVKKDDDEDDDDDEIGGCLHGEGLELFGNLYED